MKDFILDVKKIFLEYPEIKAVLASIGLAISWVFDGEYQALIAMGALTAIDFLTGTYFALKTWTWNSPKSTDGVVKIFRFSIFILTSRLVDKCLPFHLFSPLMDIYIGVTQAGSILENFQKLGYPVPTLILKKLKEMQEKKGQ